MPNPTPFDELQSKCEELDVAYETLELRLDDLQSRFFRTPALGEEIFKDALDQITIHNLPELFIIIRVAGETPKEEDLHASPR